MILKSLISNIFNFFLRQFFNLLLILLVLLLGRVVLNEWKQYQSAWAESVQLAEVDKTLTSYMDRLAKESADRLMGMGAASLQMLDLRMMELEKTLSTKRLEKQKIGGIVQLVAGVPIVHGYIDGIRLGAEINILEQERNFLQELKLRVLATQADKVQRAQLRQLSELHHQVYAEWQGVKKKREKLNDLHPLKCLLGYSTPEYAQCSQLKAQQEVLLDKNRRAAADYQRQQALLTNIRPLTALPLYAVRRSELDAIVLPLRTRLAELHKMQSDSWIEKLKKPIEEVAATAWLIFLGIMVTPIFIKAIFYFVLAPMAARRPPIHLLAHTTGDLSLETGYSTVSRAVEIDADHELLVHPEFLQSASVRGDKDTRWLLNHQFPLTSLASGMVALTRIRTLSAETFFISSTKDLFSEIGILSLPQGAALVMQPHNLVGLILRRDSPVQITSHWRLGSLHAWLTLQLRYLAFHGPAQLIVQGCRGIQIERADAGRSINQAATIGFSANLAYSTRRCETFSAYLFGKQALLNDHFSGGHGFFVYEEMPHSGQSKGIGRSLEGLADSLLKVLGV